VWCELGVLAEFVIMIMCDLDFCDECWNFVGMSTSSLVKNLK